MAFESKVILESAILMVVKSNTLKEAYDSLVVLASVEGKQYPSYEDFKKSLADSPKE